MARIDTTRCPACNAGPGTLSIRQRLIAHALGSHSLSGNQMKVSATCCPVLTCSACGLHHVGHFDSDQYAVFPPIPEEQNVKPPQVQ